MVTRNLLMAALAATVSVGLAESAAGASGPAAPRVIMAMEPSVVAPSFRAEIDSYVREINERVRTTLNEDLRRELTQKVVFAGNELRTRG